MWQGEASMFTRAMDYAVLLGLSMVFNAAVFMLKHVRAADKRRYASPEQLAFSVRDQRSLSGDDPSLW
jgi:hypothetical protein